MSVIHCAGVVRTSGASLSVCYALLIPTRPTRWLAMSIEHLHAVPNLTTALTGPLLTIEQHLLERQAAIEAWLRRQWLETPAPFYSTEDQRNAGNKHAPEDTKHKPAGFNNLNPAG